ncbi:tripartite tricarboxylate transporter TctB family protein [Orrella sp. JC864]|uniref:tripartite tricarboxylate transporter TctB family protein n=1 Tax=Orrella sp. JC864 TaxID=3120298 RepID=UPI003009D464
MTQANESGQAPQRGLATRRIMEMAVAAMVGALAALAIWDNHRIGAGWSDDGPQAGYFPMWIGIIVLACCVVNFVQAWRQGERTAFVTGGQLRQVFVVLAPLVVYVALIGPLGIYVSSALFLAGFMIAVGRFAWWKSVLFSAALLAAFFWVFELQFRVSLPKGPLEAALGF